MDFEKSLETSIRKDDTMLPNLYDVRPTPFSQTTNNIEEVIKTETNYLGFFNIDAPIIDTRADDWRLVADQVLKEHSELWEQLAKL
jgi:hypothetical protein